MVNVIGIRFKPNGKIYYLKKGNLNVENGNYIIVETKSGVDIALVVISEKQMSEDLAETLDSPLRVATEQDLIRREKNIEDAKDASDIFNKYTKEYNLDMELIDCSYIFDREKIVFYFVAEQRLDFRELVKKLASILKTRIELRQVGVRDKAKKVGGIGICGRVLCCKTFLSEFQTVSIKMAKDQNISLNPVKISGACDRLMCCLNYENDTYRELLKNIPKVGSLVKTKDGNGMVLEANGISAKVKVNIKSSNGLETPIYYDAKDVVLIKEANREFDRDEIKNLKNLQS